MIALPTSSASRILHVPVELMTTEMEVTPEGVTKVWSENTAAEKELQNTKMRKPNV